MPQTKPRKASQGQRSRRNSVPKNRRIAASGRRADSPSPGEYATEAAREWGKAVRYGAAALASAVRRAGFAATETARARRERRKERRPLRERLNPSETEKGGRVGDLADKLLSKMGAPGKVASAFSVGSRVVERVRRRDEDGSQNDAQAAHDQEESDDAFGTGDGFGGRTPIPIQESIEVSLPIEAVYALSTGFADYPEFIDRIAEAEETDDGVVFVARARGLHRRIEIEIEDERPNERIDWQATAGLAHSGVVSFHQLAPRLTRIELTIEVQPEGLLDRVARATHLTQRAIRADLRRFKAYGELWEDDGGAEPEEDEAEEERGEPEEDETDVSEEPTDKAAEEGEDEEFEEEELDDDEELEDEDELEEEEDFEDEDELDEEPLTASSSQ